MKPTKVKTKDGEILKQKRNSTLERYMSTKRFGANNIIKRKKEELKISTNEGRITEKDLYIKNFLDSLNSFNSTDLAAQKKDYDNMHKKKTIVFVLRKSKEYDVDYLERILISLKNNVKADVEYVCLSDINVSKYCKWVKFEYDWPGWWSKLELFSHPYLKGKEVVYFDLDTVIQNDITQLIVYDHNFSMLRDFYFKDRYGSGIMAWKGDRSYITRQFDLNKHPKEYVTSENWGDQAFIRDHVKDEISILQDQSKVSIASYKVARKKRVLTKDIDIVCFHGKPRPRDVKWRV